MSDIIKDLRYFDVYVREATSRTNKLARISAKRELVETAKHIMGNSEFELLPEKRRQEVAVLYLTYTADLCGLDGETLENGDPAKIIAWQIDTRARADNEINLNTALRRVDMEKQNERFRRLCRPPSS